MEGLAEEMGAEEPAVEEERLVETALVIRAFVPFFSFALSELYPATVFESISCISNRRPEM